MFEPPKLLSMSLTASASTPGRRDVGAEPVERQDRRREEDFLRISGTLKALAIVCDHLALLRSSSRQVPPAASIFSAPWR